MRVGFEQEEELVGVGVWRKRKMNRSVCLRQTYAPWDGEKGRCGADGCG